MTDTPKSPASTGYARLLRSRNFFLLWFGQLVSQLGDALAAIALLVYITDHSDGAGAISLLALVQLLPVILVGPVAGVFVDRWDRKKTMIIADCLEGLLFLALIIRPGDVLVYTVALLSTMANMFYSPARSAIIPEVVDKDDMTAAIGLQQSASQGVNLLGPMLGGVMVAFLGAKAVFVFNAATFFFSALAVGLASMPRHARWAPRTQVSAETGAQVGSVGKFFSELTFGVNFLRRNAALWFIVTTLAAFGIVGRFTFVGSMAYLRQDLSLAPALFGLLMTLSGAGALIGALLAGAQRRVPPGKAYYLGFVAMVAVLVPYLWRPGFAVLVPLWFLSGLFSSVFQVPLTSIFYTHTPVEVRGKVFSVTNALLNGAGLVSLPLASLVVARLGSAETIGLVGLLGVVYAALTLLMPGSKILLSEGKPELAEAA